MALNNDTKIQEFFEHVVRENRKYLEKCIYEYIRDLLLQNLGFIPIQRTEIVYTPYNRQLPLKCPHASSYLAQQEDPQ